MRDWNVVASVHEGGYREACQLLEQFGQVSHTHYCNVLVAKVADPRRLIATLTEWAATYPDIPTFLARVTPVTAMFNFG